MDERAAKVRFRANLRLLRSVGWKLAQRGNGWLVNDALGKPVTGICSSPALALLEAVMLVRLGT